MGLRLRSNRNPAGPVVLYENSCSSEPSCAVDWTSVAAVLIDFCADA
jgi:hypothetical protein